MALDSVRQRDARRRGGGERGPGKMGQQRRGKQWGRDARVGGSALNEARVIFNHEESLPRRVARVFLVERGIF